MILLTILVVAVIMDFRERRISNRLILLGLVCSLIFRVLGEGSIGIVHFLVNISIPVILLFLLFQLRILGAGDIKLFSVVGGFLDAEQLLSVMIAAFFAAAVIGIAKIVYQKVVVRKACGSITFIHFSFAILIGYVVNVWGCAIG